MDSAAIATLRNRLRGEVITPHDPPYEQARRVWNGSIDRHPAVIARCADAEDVQCAVTFGREQDLLTAVRGGGHSFLGLSTCDDGLVIDLSPMKASSPTRGSPASRSAGASAGCTAGTPDDRQPPRRGGRDRRRRDGPRAPRGEH